MAQINSLRRTISIDCTKKAFPSAIALIISLSKGNSVVVVEGQFDKTIFEKFFASKIYVIPCTGRGYIEKIFRKLPKTIVSVIGLADRDYSIKGCSDSRVFFYDYNNIEMMLFSNDDIFINSSLFSSNGGVSKESLVIRRNNILKTLFPISVFRLTKSKADPNNVIGIQDVVDDLLLYKSFDNNALSSHIISKIHACAKKGANQLFKTAFVSNYNNELSKTHNHFDITQGHDFITLFCDSEAIKEDVLRYNIKLAYSNVLFSKSLLYKSIKKFELLQATSLLSC